MKKMMMKRKRIINMIKLKSRWKPFPISLSKFEPPKDEKIVEKIKKDKELNWKKKDERYIMSIQKFKIYVYRISNQIKKMYIGDRPPNDYWELATSKIPDLSWEIAEDRKSGIIYFRALKMGNPFSNVYKQNKKDTKSNW